MSGRHASPSPRRRLPLVMLAVVLIGLAAVGVALAQAPAEAPAAVAPVPTVPAAVVPEPVEVPPEPVVEVRSTVIVEGKASIGEIAAPGLWMSAGGPECRWSRDAGTSWSFDTGGHPTEPITISLRLGTEFETRACAPWSLVRAVEE